MGADHPGEATSELIHGDPSVELSSNRTSLSFERTRMSADRTLMSTVRTSLSLISFGFTIHEVFSKAAHLVPDANQSGRRLGLALLFLGVVMLIAGIAGHRRFDVELTRRREHLYGLGLLRRAMQYKATPTYMIAMALLAVGLVTLASVALRFVG